MALTHLVDTSVLTRLREPAVAEQLMDYAQAGRVARSSMSDLELGYSARNADEFDRIMASVAVFDVLAVAESHMQRALQVQRQLAASSQRGRKVPDLIIAAAAEAARLTILHYDADYDLIADATGQPVEWVVPAGSID